MRVIMITSAATVVRWNVDLCSSSSSGSQPRRARSRRSSLRRPSKKQNLTCVRCANQFEETKSSSTLARRHFGARFATLLWADMVSLMIVVGRICISQPIHLPSHYNHLVVLHRMSFFPPPLARVLPFMLWWAMLRRAGGR
jgi:hypothetical protein